jgi:ribosomal protein S18 acetylase RimI-like enzyme
MSADFTVRFRIQIRPLDQADLTDLAWDSEGAVSPATVRKHLLARPGEVVFLAAFANASPIGRLGLDFGRKGKEGVVHLWSFGILPSFQRLGIGTALIRAAEELASERGVATAEIGVEEWNQDARRLYERLAYRLSGEEKDDRGETILLLRRSLV